MKTLWPDVDKIADISDSQRGALKTAFSRGRLGVLTGGPGTGKTHTVAAAIREIIRSGSPVSICAPTGRAAVRVNELLDRRGLRTASAKTIHRLLGCKAPDSDGWDFYHNRHHPLDCSVLIVDESSMIANSLFRSLISAVDKRTHVLLVGDPWQLQPVGNGRPFLDIINSGRFGNGFLDQPFRFAGRIAQVCREIRLRQEWSFSPRGDLDAEFPENLVHADSHPQYVGRTVKNVLDRLRSDGVDLREQVQVVVPTNPLRVESNAQISEWVWEWENTEVDHSLPFQVNDKIIWLDNTWLVPQGEADKVLFANGEIGVVLDADNDFTSIRIREYTLEIRTNDVESLVSSANAITLHKAQGSQWDYTVIVADSSFVASNRICNWTWWYTAMSRAAKMTIVVGPESVIRQQCRSDVGMFRKTFLEEMLRGS